MQELAAGLGFIVDWERLVDKDASGYFVRLVPNGTPLVILRHPDTGTRLRFIPEQTYAPNTSAIHSTSFDQRTHVAVEVEHADGTVALFVFDPKYKLVSEDAMEGNPDGTPTKTDIDKMHAYRDAIRGQDGRHITRTAAILYPGRYMRYPQDAAEAIEVEAIRAYPGEFDPIQLERLMQGRAADPTEKAREPAPQDSTLEEAVARFNTAASEAGRPELTMAIDASRALVALAKQHLEHDASARPRWQNGG